MNNADKELQRRNQEKERIEGILYEIPFERDTGFMDAKFENEDIVLKIAHILIENDLTYKEANRVLYHADKALHEMALNKTL